MPSITRRRLLGGGVAIATGTSGTYLLNRGATNATFTSWTPAPGTWPLRRYDPANTAHNPNASPPRETPTSHEVGSASTSAKRPYFHPIVSDEYVAMYGSGIAVYPRGGGDAVRADDMATPLAGFGPDDHLHSVRREPGDFDTPSAVVGYGADELRETYRFPLDTEHPEAMTVGSREVYVGDESGTLRAVDSGSGRRWRVDGSMPALVDGQLYAADAPLDGTVAYAPRAGLDRRLQVGPERAWSAGPTPGFPYLPAVADGRLMLGSYAEGDGAVVAFDAESGERLWEPRFLGTDVSTPAVVGDRGYAAVGTDNLDTGLVVALDLETGETIWRDETEWHAFAPVVGDSTLVVAGEVRENQERAAGKVRAYDSATGEVLWTHTLGAQRLGGLALVEDRVFVTTGTSLYELT